MGILDTLFGDSDTSDAQAALERNRTLYNDVELPDYKEYTPELYDNESADYKLLSEDPVLKSKQMEAAAQFGDLANEGLSDADMAGFSEARGVGDQLAKSREDAAINDAQVRGVGGSGLEFALREAGNQAGASRALESANSQATARAGQRADYLKAYAGQMGQMRDQDARTNQANTNAINQFNLANTQQRNATNASNVDSRNQAFQYNEGIKDKNFGNQMKRADSMAGINNQQSQVQLAGQAADAERDRAILGAGGSILGGYLAKK